MTNGIENARLEPTIRTEDELQQRLQQSVVIGPTELERFRVTGQAIGVSLRQAKDLLETLWRATACQTTPSWGAGPRRRVTPRTSLVPAPHIRSPGRWLACFTQTAN